MWSIQRVTFRVDLALGAPLLPIAHPLVKRDLERKRGRELQKERDLERKRESELGKEREN